MMFPRERNLATFTCDVIAVSASADATSCVVKVETNAEGGDNDVQSIPLTYELTAKTSPAAYIRFRMLSPEWYSN